MNKELQKWKPQEERFTKVNVDAAFWEETHEGGTGAGLRNHEGNLLRAQSIWDETGLNARSLEAYAIRDGIQLAAYLGYRKVIIESDAQQVIKQCNSPGVDRSEIATTVNEIQELCGNFEELPLVFIHREANELAQLCARQCRSSRRRCICINYVPSFLTACAMKGCNPAV